MGTLSGLSRSPPWCLWGPAHPLCRRCYPWFVGPCPPLRVPFFRGFRVGRSPRPPLSAPALEVRGSQRWAGELPPLWICCYSVRFGRSPRPPLPAPAHEVRGVKGGRGNCLRCGSFVTPGYENSPGSCNLGAMVVGTLSGLSRSPPWCLWGPAHPFVGGVILGLWGPAHPSVCLFCMPAVGSPPSPKRTAGRGICLSASAMVLRSGRVRRGGVVLRVRRAYGGRKILRNVFPTPNPYENQCF